MSNVIPQHVFISFSQDDREFVYRLADDLKQAGIKTWVDYEKLIAGTPDWEAAIRDAIDASFAVLLVASPDSRKSIYVKGELNVAQARGRPIYPVLATDDAWIDCIPLGMSNTQYINCRAGNYSTGLKQITDILNRVIESSIPKHYLVDAFRTIWRLKNYTEINYAPIPPGYIAVELSKLDRYKWGDEKEEAAVMMKVSAFPSVRHLLDELHTYYLRDHFKPLTYGRDWILVEYSFLSRVVIPWAWLQCPDKSQYELDRKWAMTTSLQTIGLEANTHWSITDVYSEAAYGLALNDARIFYGMRQRIKGSYFFRHTGCLEEVSIHSVNPTDYQFTAVVTGLGNYGIVRLPTSLVFKQTDQPVDEEEMKYWLEDF